MYLGPVLTLVSPRRAPRFSPASLFAGGEHGAFFDPSDLSTMFQDDAGTVPAAVGSVVGRINDKSGRGNHATQATTANKPILRQSGSLYYLEFDGVDDFLATPAIGPAVDSVTASVALLKANDLAVGVPLETGGSSAGSFSIFAPVSSTSYGSRSRGTAASDGSYTDASVAGPHTAVLTLQADISSDTNILQINGVQRSSSATDQGTGVYGNYPLYIGMRAGTTLPFVGNIYSAIVLFRAATTDELANINWFGAHKAGLTI